MPRKLKLVAKVHYDVTRCECGNTISRSEKSLTNICPSCGNVYTSDGSLIFKSPVNSNGERIEEDVVMHG